MTIIQNFRESDKQTVPDKQIIPDKKRDYLIKTLSRTKRKDYENYVINSIYHKLCRDDIKPVTQQYVKRSDGKYALLDLYFPQLNYGIECDEGYHINNVENDEKRVMTMEDMLGSVEETSGFILRRVSAYKDICSINSEIDGIVDEIKVLLEERTIEVWDIDFIPYEHAIAKKTISVTDRLQFRTIADVCKCFGRNYDKGMQQSFINLKTGYFVWCPKLAIVTDGEQRAVSQGWVNVLSDDWETIRERNEAEEKNNYAIKFAQDKRVIFAKSKDALGRNNYRFIGVFCYSSQLSTSDTNVYARVDTHIELSNWLK